MNVRHLVCCALLMTASCAFNLRAEENAQQKFMQLEHDVHTLFQEKKYEDAAAKCREQLVIAPNNSNAHYNLACALARLSKPDDAFKSLQAAVDNGFTDVAHIKQDDDLESLLKDDRFEKVLASAREKEKSSFERGAEIKGVKTIDDVAEGGLRYRVRMSDTATEEKPLRLIVWLHPSGGSMNNVAEAMSPALIEKGFALVVLTKKNWMGWNGEDADKLLNKTLPAVAKIKGIDARRPVLMGFSAGGQLALQLWGMGPEQYGGLVVDAAYPLDMEKYQQGKTAAQELPKGEGLKKVPIFAICGGNDGGTQLWNQVKDDWTKAGVPLTLKVIPGKGHQWLFGKDETDELLKWLSELK